MSVSIMTGGVIGKVLHAAFGCTALCGSLVTPGKCWRTLHPDTLALSVGGVEDQNNAYDNYFKSAEGFRDTHASDTRLETKTPIFAFRMCKNSYAVGYSDIVGGHKFQLNDQEIYLYRSDSAKLFDSTQAYLLNASSDCNLAELASATNNDACAEPLSGFDTFWYNWSLNNPGTQLLLK